MEDFSSQEREQVQLLVRSHGWKVIMERIMTPLLLQTNLRLDAPGTQEPQTQLLRGSKQTLKHIIETVYNLGQMPNPFNEHMNAFMVTLNVQAGIIEEVDPQTYQGPTKGPLYQGPLKGPLYEGPPKKRSLSPVL